MTHEAPCVVTQPPVQVECAGEFYVATVLPPPRPPGAPRSSRDDDESLLPLPVVQRLVQLGRSVLDAATDVRLPTTKAPLHLQVCVCVCIVVCSCEGNVGHCALLGCAFQVRLPTTKAPLHLRVCVCVCVCVQCAKRMLCVK